MATVTAFTAARTAAIEAAAIISGTITGNNLILSKFDGTTVNAGNVRGPQGNAMWPLTTTIANISEVTGAQVGDSFVNTTSGTFSILGQSTAGGSIAKSLTATTATGAGSLKGTTGATGATGAVSSVVQDPWHNVGDSGEPAFVNSWVNEPGNLTRFYKDPGGVVTLEIAVRSGANGTTAFTLPAGYRPSQAMLFPVLLSAGVAGGYLSISAGGLVQPTKASAATLYASIQFPTGPGTAFPVGAAAVVSTLPTTPIDGQEVYFQNSTMAAEGIMWHLRYRAAAAGAYKWDVLGGSPLGAEITTTETVTATSYADLTTVGPSIALPLAGDYDVNVAHRPDVTSAGNALYMSYAIGATAASDNDSAVNYTTSSGIVASHINRTRRKTGLGAVTLTAKYRTGASTPTRDRRITAMPIRVG